MISARSLSWRIWVHAALEQIPVEPGACVDSDHRTLLGCQSGLDGRALRPPGHQAEGLSSWSSGSVGILIQGVYLRKALTSSAMA